MYLKDKDKLINIKFPGWLLLKGLQENNGKYEITYDQHTLYAFESMYGCKAWWLYTCFMDAIKEILKLEKKSKRGQVIDLHNFIKRIEERV